MSTYPDPFESGNHPTIFRTSYVLENGAERKFDTKSSTLAEHILKWLQDPVQNVRVKCHGMVWSAGGHLIWTH